MTATDSTHPATMAPAEAAAHAPAPPINLIPRRRLDARQRRAWTARAVTACAAYAVLVAAGSGLTYVVAGTAGVRDRADARDLPAQLADAAGQIDRTNAALAAAQSSLEETESSLRASRAITDQPDWSRLMALLARKSDGQVVLRACEVRPRDGPAAPPAAKPGTARAAEAEPAILVHLSGLGASQAAVSEYALRLEATGLFKQVAMLDTARESIDARPVVAFRIECTLTDRMPPVAGRRPAGGPSASAGGEK